MSAHQMLCHLRDTYGVALSEKIVSPATGFWQRTLAKRVALWVPARWIKGYPTRSEGERGKGGSRPYEFAADKHALQMVLTRFCHNYQEPFVPHPVFGRMNIHEWSRWGYLNADHHPVSSDVKARKLRLENHEVRSELERH